MELSINNFFKLIRPHQYIKNLFIFMPLFFVGKITNGELFLNAVMAFVAFSMTASAIYILNDYQDLAVDRLHPQKKFRPLTSGAISRKAAIIIMVTLFIMGMSLMAMLSLAAFGILSVYIILNIGYSFYLKHVAIVDVVIISIGFVLRLFVGSIATETLLSMWIVILTFLLALFLALAKRRDDVLLFVNKGKKMRKSIDGYNLQLIDGAMMVMAAVIIVSYILYTTSIVVLQRIHSEYLYLTTLFVIMGVLRYLQIAFVENNSGSPTRIALGDKFMQLTILAWVFSFVWILYL